jgi:hypothetical protein
MARIRTLKPEFWGDEKMAPLDPTTRLVFLGLISLADDAGRLVDNVKTIDGQIFPATDDTSRESLDILARLSRIIRYTAASGQKLIQLRHWERHQKVDKPGKHVLPGPSREDIARQEVAESSREARESVAEVSRSDLGPRTMDLGPRTVDQGRASRRTPKAAPFMGPVRSVVREVDGPNAQVPVFVVPILRPLMAAAGEEEGVRRVRRFCLRVKPQFRNWHHLPNMWDSLTSDEVPASGGGDDFLQRLAKA